MAIKLYKSQLTPTTESSNVMNRNRVSMSEAASIGNAWKGMVKSGELLYAKHQDIKTDNEVLEKIKEVNNGTDNYTGLSETKINASQMSDPDAAGKLYNDEWQNIFDNVNGSLSGKQAQRKFKSFMTKQNLKDVNAIKTASTTNMINALRINTLDQIETLKKTAIFGTSLEKNIASKELSDLLGSKKTSDIFGNTLQKVVKQTNNEIAFTGYKRMPYEKKDEVLAAAQKDKRITADDLLKLEKHFNATQTTDNNLNKDNVSKMKSSLDDGILFTEDEFNAAVSIATTNDDQATLIKLKNMAFAAPIIQDLNNKTVAQIEEKINFFTTFKNKEGGMTNNEATELKLSQDYLAKLNTSLDKDLVGTAADKGLIAISEINFEDVLNGGDMSAFVEGAKTRIAQAETASGYYKREVKYLTTTEANTMRSVLKNADSAEQIISLTSGITKAFGVKSDKIFKQISKDDSVLAHMGGLVLMNDGVVGENVNLLAQGLIISKNETLAKLYKATPTDIKDTDVMKEFSKAFVENSGALNSTLETATLIYAAQQKNNGKTEFNTNDFEKAFMMAAGGTTIEKLGFDKKMGAFDKDSRDNSVHIPPWLERGKFDNVIKMLKSEKGLFKLASSNDKLPMLDGEDYTVDEIFAQDPHFVSVGNGKYKIAQGEHPSVSGAEEEYLMNSDGGIFVIDINKIKSEIINGMK